MWGLALADFGRDLRSSSLRGMFFKKTQKSLTKFPGLVTSGCHYFVMITNAENPFLPLESLRIIGLYAAYQKGTYPKFSATSLVRYCAIVRYSAGAAQSRRYGSCAA